MNDFEKQVAGTTSDGLHSLMACPEAIAMINGGSHFIRLEDKSDFIFIFFSAVG